MDERFIRYTFDLMKQPDEVIEIRIISSKTNYSGYFKSVDNIINAIKDLKENNYNAYFILNTISDACYSREQTEKLIERTKITTSDKDITERNWLLIDIDPKRPSGVSSTDIEKEKAKVVINKIYAYLRDFGFAAPIVCDSGNGYHLLYKIKCENSSVNASVMQKLLLVLDMYFGTPDVDIDKTVYNAARVTKLYGTIARKGANTTERPHRLSKLHKVPSPLKETPFELLVKLSKLLPQPEKPTFQNNYNKDAFNLDEFISKHNIDITSQIDFAGGTKYILKNCLFDSNHKGKDAAIIKLSNGAIAYKCFHDSCSQYSWKDVRQKFEPNAYDKQYINESRISINRVTKPQDIKPQQETVEKGKKFLSISEVEAVDRSQIVSMPSGFRNLDKKLIGFNKGEVTLWSGKNGSAKSTILNQVALNHIQTGFNGAIFSGELQAHKLKNWLYLQAAGRQFTREHQSYEGIYYITKDISKKIDKWLDGKLFIYNNDYGNNYSQLLEDFKEVIDQKQLDWVMFDNLMALDLDDDGYNSNKQQKKFILEVSSISKKKNIHTHIVAHPRKDTGFLRKESISGTADLTNAVENVIICHRNNTDYQKSAKDYFPKVVLEAIEDASNYLEVCKNRDLGIMDFIIGLHYEKESKRLLNDKYENKVYAWQDELQVEVSQEPSTHDKNQLLHNYKVENNFDIPTNDDFYSDREDPPF